MGAAAFGTIGARGLGATIAGTGSAGSVTWLGRFEGRLAVNAGTGVERAFGVAISGSAACGIGTGGCGRSSGTVSAGGVGWAAEVDSCRAVVVGGGVTVGGCAIGGAVA